MTGEWQESKPMTAGKALLHLPSSILHPSAFASPYELQLPPWLARFSGDVPVLFPLARVQCGARAVDRRGHSGLQPREFSGSAAGRVRPAPGHQLSGARKFVPVSRDGRVVAFVEAVPVDRDGGGAAGLKAILDRLLAGGVIILFPEGTRTRDGKLQPARSGIGLMVIKSDALVVPVRTFGTFEAYGRHITFPRPKPVAVKYGRPMKFEAIAGRGEKLFQGAAQGNLPADCQRNHGGDCGIGAGGRHEYRRSDCESSIFAFRPSDQRKLGLDARRLLRKL